MITLTIEDTDDLERILEALETQAFHHEMSGHYASADICRLLAQDLSAQNPELALVEHSHQSLSEYEIQTESGEVLQTLHAESADAAYDTYVEENFGNGNCGWSVDVMEVSTGTVVEF